MKKLFRKIFAFFMAYVMIILSVFFGSAKAVTLNEIMAATTEKKEAYSGLNILVEKLKKLKMPRSLDVVPALPEEILENIDFMLNAVIELQDFFCRQWRICAYERAHPFCCEFTDGMVCCTELGSVKDQIVSFLDLETHRLKHGVRLDVCRLHHVHTLLKIMLDCYLGFDDDEWFLPPSKLVSLYLGFIAPAQVLSYYLK